MNNEKLILSGDSWRLAALVEYSVRNKFSLQNIRVVRFPDDKLEIYGEIDERKVGEIQSYIFCHAAESGQAYADVSLFSEDRVFDLIYLYPVFLLSSGPWKALISKIISQEQLVRILYFYEFPVAFPDLDPSVAKRATDLLRVRLLGRLSLRFSDSTLFIEACGYLQIQEILKLFGECCVEALLIPTGETTAARIDESPETFDLKLYYTTVETEGRALETSYYIKSSSGSKISLWQDDQDYRDLRYNSLQKKIISGELLPRETKNIMRAYPNFVPTFKTPSIISRSDQRST